MKEYNEDEIFAQEDENIVQNEEKQVQPEKKTAVSSISELRSNYKRICEKLNKTLVTEDDLARYQMFKISLDELNEMSDYFYTKGENGYPMVDSLSLDALKNTYASVINACQDIMASPNNEGIALQMKGIAKDLSSLLQADHAALESYIIDEKNPLTLDKIIELGRTITVDVGDAQLSSASGALSERIPISIQGPNGKRDGFFTKTQTLNSEAKFKKLYDKYRTKYPDLAGLITSLENNANRLKLETLTEYTYNYAEAPADKAGYELDELIEDRDAQEILNAAKEGYADTLNRLLPPPTVSQYKNNPDFVRFCSEIGGELKPLIQEYKCFISKGGNDSWLGIEDGSNIDKRNAAMSAVAGLLTDKKIIAKSEPVIVMVNGVPTSGTFMEKADKWDAYDFSPENPMINAGPDVYDNYRVFGDIASLQAIDYICGNIDRHKGNIRMRFEEIDGKLKLVGITGIDNDMAFGPDYPANNPMDNIGNKFVTPAEMGVIGEEMATKILALSEETLTATLRGYGLSKEQITAAWERTKILQNAINAGKDHYEKNNVPEGKIDNGFLRVVKENHWDKYTLESLSEHRNNQFDTLRGMRPAIADAMIVKGRDERLAQKDAQLKQVVYGIEPQPKPEKQPLVFVEANIIGTGIATIDPNIDRLGVDNPDNIKVRINPEQVLGSVGNYSSSRVPIAYTNLDGKSVPGYFTFATTVNVQNQVRKMVNDEIEKVSKGNHPEWANILRQTHNYIKQDLGDIFNSYNVNHYDLKKIGLTAAQARQFENNQEFQQMYANFLNNVQQTYNKVSASYGNAGINADKNGRIDTRNVAFSKVSELLGAGDIIAKSSTMQVQIGNKIHDGIFMEEAPGKNIESIKPGEPEATITSAAFDNTMVLKDIADMQILDFICGNVDRNENNFLCEFNNDNPPKCIRIMGIDNDNSFGKAKIDPDEPILNSIPIENIKVISESMAYRITHMDPDALTHTLEGQGLSQGEIDAAKDRFYQVFDKIKDKSISVVKDNEWTNYKISDLAADPADFDKTNFFNRVISSYDVMLPMLLVGMNNNIINDNNIEANVDKTKRKALATEIEDFSDVAKENTETEQLEESAENEINNRRLLSFNDQQPNRGKNDREIIDQLKEYTKYMYDEVKSSYSWFYGGDQYTDLLGSTNTLKNRVNELDRKLRNGGSLTADDMNSLMERLTDVNEKSIIYTQYKYDELESRGIDPENPGTIPKNRIAAARYAQDTANKLYSVVKTNQMIRDVIANPETEIYGRISKYQSHLNNPDLSDREVKLELASVIYFNTIANSVQKLKSGNKIVNAMVVSEFNKGVNEITSSSSFRKMMEETPKEELIASARERNGQGLFNKFIKNVAKEMKKPENEKKNDKKLEKGKDNIINANVMK